MSEQTLSNHFLRHFVQVLESELGHENLATVLAKANMPSDWSDPARSRNRSGTNAAETYSGLQKAIRTYYGRGARGILIRVGGNLWERLLDNAPLALKVQAKFLNALPVNARRKSILELLARLLANQSGDVTVHTLDMDLLFADHASPGTVGQRETAHICYVSLGLVRECLFWASGQEHDIEETSCRATGDEVCEFKITIGI